MERITRFFFTIWAYATFIFLMFFAFAYHVLVMLFTWGKGIDLMYKCYKPWTYLWGFLNGVHYDIRGREYIKKRQPYIYVANHESVGDMFTIAAVSDLRFRPLGKLELTYMPFMGYMFKRALVLVDRSSPESRKKSIEKMKEKLDQGISILILPEGTRNRTGKPLKDFYNGAFRLAIECQIPIVPMVMINTRTLHPNDDWLMNRIDLKCIFKEPISTNGLTEDSIKELKDRVYRIMEKEILMEDVLFKSELIVRTPL